MPEEQSGDLPSSTLTRLGLPSRYANATELGAGGMGIVLLADDKLLGRKVAIKIIKPEAESDEVSRERFLRESRALASLDHPNIVKILNSGLSEAACPYYVMELVEGKSLAEYLNENETLSPKEFRNVFSQVLSGLACAHENKIVHRDLKPSNIILDSRNGGIHCKIIDFGIARFDDISSDKAKTITGSSALLGSPAYMSPEQCRGAKADFKSDIYSVGCIMYECLSGQAPFVGSSALDTMYKHMNEKQASLETQAVFAKWKSLARLVDQCLEKNPELRPNTVKQLQEELENIFRQGSETSGKFMLPASQSGLKRSHHFLVIAMSFSFLLAVFALAYLAKESRLQQESEIPSNAQQEIRTQEHACNELRSRFLNSKEAKVRFERGKTLSRNLTTLSILKIDDAQKDKVNKIKKLKEVIPLLTEAIKLSGSHKFSVDLLCTRAECELQCGDADAAEKDFERASTYALNNLKKESWDYLVSLQRWADAELNQGKWQSAMEIVSKLLSGWDIDAYLDHPNDSVGSKLSNWLQTLSTEDFVTSEGRLTQLELILQISDAILLKKKDRWIHSAESDGQIQSETYRNTCTALKATKANLLPLCKNYKEYPELLSKLNRIISSYEKLNEPGNSNK